MIRENLIEVKANAQPHDDDTFLLCQDAIQQVLLGKVAVLCDKHIDQLESGLFVAPGKYEGSQNSDTGTVLRSGYKHLKEGDRVGFLPMHGIRCSQPDHPWVPEGCEIRIFGLACGANDSLVRLVESELYDFFVQNADRFPQKAGAGNIPIGDFMPKG